MLRALLWSVSVIVTVSAMIFFLSLPSRAQEIPAPIAPIAPLAPMPGWFPVQTQVWVGPYQVSVAVANVFSAPIACQGQLQAWGAYVGPQWMNFALGAFFPGTWSYAYMYPAYGDYFVSAQATAYCWYL